MCLVTFLQAANLSVNQCNHLFNIGNGGTGSTICNSCASGESHSWVDSTTYSNNYIDQLTANPSILVLEKINLVFTGINLQTGNSEELRCQLDSFDLLNEMDNLKVTLIDGKSCSPFKLFGQNTHLSIANSFNSDSDFFYDGKLINDSAGNILEKPVIKNFTPSTELVLTVDIDELDPYELNN